MQWHFYLRLLVLVPLMLSNLVQAQSYFTNGTAKSVGGQCYELTKATNNQNGSVWYAEQLDLTKPFDLEFTLNLGSNDGGADGIVFVLQTVGTNALGSSGGGLGFEGFSPSLGIEFDTWYNDIGDISEDHIAIMKNGSVNHNTGNSIVGPIKALLNGGNIEDGKNHPVRIQWYPDTKDLRVWFECAPRISKNIDLVKDIFNGKSMVYWGFTAATGGANNRQVACLRDDIIVKKVYNVCEGDGILLNARESKNNSYLWQPATFLSSTTTKQPVCNPTASQTYTVTFKDICDNSVVDTVVVNVSKKISISLGRDSLLCDGKSITYNIADTFDLVRWENGLVTNKRTISAAGKYTVEAWRGVCTAKDEVVLTTLEKPELRIDGDIDFCSGESVVLQVSVAPQDQVFEWDNGSSSAERLVNQAGTYWVRAKNVCGSDSVVKNLSELVIDGFELGNDTTICDGDALNIDVPLNNQYTFNWSNGDQDQKTSLTTAGLYWLKVSLGKCSQSDSINVAIRKPPKILLPNEVLLCRNERLTLDPKVIDAKVLWQENLTNPTFELFEFDGPLKVKASNNCGSDSMEILVNLRECFCDVFYPNAITPNDDGLNETFGATKNCQKVLAYQLQVYNRWGQLMFETFDSDARWDGNYKKQPAIPGVYVWIANYTGMVGGQPTKYSQSGTLLLMR